MRRAGRDDEQTSRHRCWQNKEKRGQVLRKVGELQRTDDENMQVSSRTYDWY